MTYSVKLHPKVDKFIKKANKSLSDRIIKKLKDLKQDPYRFLEHFEGDDFYKVRIGDYRALIDIDKDRKILFVRYLDHRSRVYKRK